MKHRELRVSIGEEFLEKLKAKVAPSLKGHISSDVEVTKLAFTLLDWAADEVADGNIIISCKHEGGEAVSEFTENGKL